ncbi:MAG: helix-turn-helix transcriptional regulator [Eubacteriales bacterium]|nr:helix-turn-helix transcriptional regulator [Eubacteriales bacterium]
MGLEEKLNNAKTVDFFSDLSDSQKKEADILACVAMLIHEKRMNMQMTQAEFAAYAGVSQTMVSKWESGEYNFTISSLSKLMTVLGYDIEFEEKKPEKKQKEVASSALSSGWNVRNSSFGSWDLPMTAMA